MSEIKLDITHINKAIICFKSKMFLSSINIVQVFTPISTINFHIINIFTLFFFA